MTDARIDFDPPAGAPSPAGAAPSSEPSQAARLLAAHPLFAGIAPEVVASLVGNAGLRRFRPGTLMFRDGDEASHWLLVAAGHVEMVRFGLDGEERVFHVFGPGQLVAEAAMFMHHGRYPMNARAQSAVSAWRFARGALRHACETHPPLAMRMLEALSARLYQRVNQVDWLVGSSAAQRLAAYLLAQRRRAADAAAPAEEAVKPGAPPLVELPLTQRRLAGHLGVRPETLNRLFAGWQRRGVVAGGPRRWTLLDVDALAALASASVRPF